MFNISGPFGLAISIFPDEMRKFYPYNLICVSIKAVISNYKNSGLGHSQAAVFKFEIFLNNQFFASLTAEIGNSPSWETMVPFNESPS